MRGGWIVLIVLALAVAGCSQNIQAPAPPVPPAGDGPTGQATITQAILAANPAYAPPWDVWNENQDVLVVEQRTDGPYVVIDHSSNSVKLTYQDVWVHDGTSWKKMVLSGTNSQYQGFLQGDLEGKIPTQIYSDQQNLVLAYVCTDTQIRADGRTVYACGCSSTDLTSCNKWNAEIFTLGGGPTPPPPPVGCTDDTDCISPLTCNIASGQCVDPTPAGCTSNAECTAPQTCNVASGQCVDPTPTSCVQTGCSSGQTCNSQTGQCEPSEIQTSFSIGDTVVAITNPPMRSTPAYVQPDNANQIIVDGAIPGIEGIIVGGPVLFSTSNPPRTFWEIDWTIKGSPVRAWTEEYAIQSLNAQCTDNSQCIYGSERCEAGACVSNIVCAYPTDWVDERDLTSLDPNWDINPNVNPLNPQYSFQRATEWFNTLVLFEQGGNTITIARMGGDVRVIESSIYVDPNTGSVDFTKTPNTLQIELSPINSAPQVESYTVHMQSPSGSVETQTCDFMQNNQCYTRFSANPREEYKYWITGQYPTSLMNANEAAEIGQEYATFRIPSNVRLPWSATSPTQNRMLTAQALPCGSQFFQYGMCDENLFGDPTSSYCTEQFRCFDQQMQQDYCQWFDEYSRAVNAQQNQGNTGGGNQPQLTSINWASLSNEQATEEYLRNVAFSWRKTAETEDSVTMTITPSKLFTPEPPANKIDLEMSYIPYLEDSTGMYAEYAFRTGDVDYGVPSIADFKDGLFSYERTFDSTDIPWTAGGYRTDRVSGAKYLDFRNTNTKNALQTSGWLSNGGSALGGIVGVLSISYTVNAGQMVAYTGQQVNFKTRFEPLGLTYLDRVDSITINFGDGTSRTFQKLNDVTNPWDIKHTYTSAGSYDVSYDINIHRYDTPSTPRIESGSFTLPVIAPTGSELSLKCTSYTDIQSPALGRRIYYEFEDHPHLDGLPLKIGEFRGIAGGGVSGTTRVIYGGTNIVNNPITIEYYDGYTWQTVVDRAGTQGVPDC